MTSSALRALTLSLKQATLLSPSSASNSCMEGVCSRQFTRFALLQPWCRLALLWRVGGSRGRMTSSCGIRWILATATSILKKSSALSASQAAWLLGESTSYNSGSRARQASAFQLSGSSKVTKTRDRPTRWFWLASRSLEDLSTQNFGPSEIKFSLSFNKFPIMKCWLRKGKSNFI